MARVSVRVLEPPNPLQVISGLERDGGLCGPIKGIAEAPHPLARCCTVMRAALTVIITVMRY